MKSFKNISAMTLIELIITIMVSTVVLVIIAFFITKSVVTINETEIKMWIINDGFKFKDTMNRYIKNGYNNISIFTWSQTPNNVLLLINSEKLDWVLFAVIDNNTNKIEQNYVYWYNYLWYRRMSDIEIWLDISNIYDLKFNNDKIFKEMKIKDFKVELYNSGAILDLKYTAINLDNNVAKWEGFKNMFIPKDSMIKVNLVY